MMYNPESWLAVRITSGDESILKIFATWRGGYVNGDSWQLNSGVKKIVVDGDYLDFHGYSGSIYRCHKDAEGTSAYTGSVLANYIQRVADGGGNMEILRDFAEIHLQDYKDLL